MISTFLSTILYFLLQSSVFSYPGMIRSSLSHLWHDDLSISTQCSWFYFVRLLKLKIAFGTNYNPTPTIDKALEQPCR
ncbi:hypothetical protein QVD17_11097 [Tagetes erecta]|uniref:Secreted protein n=1 Tax=Tagetes erecta TaxID=13708 RepID=A0AAD8P5D9_TARER|nr:hypothetical protein QVD17_11097 [Tagetes erecta]